MWIVSTEKSWNALSSPPCKTRMQHLLQGIPCFRAFQALKALINVLKEIRITANCSAKKNFRVYSRSSFFVLQFIGRQEMTEMKNACDIRSMLIKYEVRQAS